MSIIVSVWNTCDIYTCNGQFSIFKISSKLIQIDFLWKAVLKIKQFITFSQIAIRHIQHEKKTSKTVDITKYILINMAHNDVRYVAIKHLQLKDQLKLVSLMGLNDLVVSITSWRLVKRWIYFFPNSAWLERNQSAVKRKSFVIFVPLERTSMNSIPFSLKE